jgi:hypothetical protein
MGLQTALAKERPLAAKPCTDDSADEKFVTQRVKWAYDRTRNPGLQCLEVSAGPDGIKTRGEP